MWLAAMITIFGIVSIGTAFVKSYNGLIITRVFLGIAEGGTLVRRFSGVLHSWANIIVPAWAYLHHVSGKIYLA